MYIYIFTLPQFTWDWGIEQKVFLSKDRPGEEEGFVPSQDALHVGSVTFPTPGAPVGCEFHIKDMDVSLPFQAKE